MRFSADPPPEFTNNPHHFSMLNFTPFSMFFFILFSMFFFALFSMFFLTHFHVFFNAKNAVILIKKNNECMSKIPRHSPCCSHHWPWLGSGTSNPQANFSLPVHIPV